jgi:hypothetical protein
MNWRASAEQQKAFFHCKLVYSELQLNEIISIGLVWVYAKFNFHLHIHNSSSQLQRLHICIHSVTEMHYRHTCPQNLVQLAPTFKKLFMATVEDITNPSVFVEAVLSL